MSKKARKNDTKVNYSDKLIKKTFYETIKVQIAELRSKREDDGIHQMLKFGWSFCFLVLPCKEGFEQSQPIFQSGKFS
jgi:hypothetical protein